MLCRARACYMYEAQSTYDCVNQHLWEWEQNTLLSRSEGFTERDIWSLAWWSKALARFGDLSGRRRRRRHCHRRHLCPSPPPPTKFNISMVSIRADIHGFNISMISIRAHIHNCLCSRVLNPTFVQNHLKTQTSTYTTKKTEETENGVCRQFQNV